MVPGSYAVLQFVPDPVRNEAINIGIVANGPAGALFQTAPTALERMHAADRNVDAETIEDLQALMKRLVTSPALHVRADGIDEITPRKPGFIDALREQMPERIRLGPTLFTNYDTAGWDAMDAAATELLERLVSPVAHTAGVA